MKFEQFAENFKKNIDYSKTGMILFHNGVVRGISRDGVIVKQIIVEKDDTKIKKICDEMLNLKGISKADALAFSGKFSPGDDLLFVGVAGDIRENVFHVLTTFVNRIKKEAVRKEEITIK